MLRKVDIFLRFTLLLACIVADAMLNSSRILTLGFDPTTQTAWIMIAISCAAAPAIVSSFSDARAIKIGFYSCIASMMMSIWAIYGAMDTKKYDADLADYQISQAKSDLQDHYAYADRQRQICKSRPASGPNGCDSMQLERDLSWRERQIKQGMDQHLTVKPVSQTEALVSTIILVLISFFLQVWGAELGRQIGQVLKLQFQNHTGSGSDKASSGSKELSVGLVPDSEAGSHGSLTRNQNQVSSEPEPKNTEKREPELKKSRTRTHSNIPSDIEKQKLKSAYGAMKKLGEKVIGETLGKKAEISKGKALWWLKHDKPQVVGL